MVEIFEASTLGSLFGYAATQLKYGWALTCADYVYVLKPPGEQNGSVSDYRAFLPRREFLGRM